MNSTIFFQLKVHRPLNHYNEARRPVRQMLAFCSICLVSIILSSCQHTQSDVQRSSHFSYPFLASKDWQGKAEIAVYRGQIMRYGQKRPARLALITVLEPFNMQQRVKANQGMEHSYAIKQNQSLNYQTGVYPYSQLNSIFWRLSNGSLIKASMTSQDWCGHTFKEAIRTDKQLILNYNSYWENEASGSQNISEPDQALLYDELPLVVRSPDFRKIKQSSVFPLLMSSQVNQPTWDIYEARREKLQYDPAKIEQESTTLRINGKLYPEVLRIKITASGPDGNLHIDSFFVDEASPNRVLLRWERHDSSVLELEELYYSPYWKRHNKGDVFQNNRM